MNPDLTQKLLETHPELYGQTGLAPTETSMCFGFECGDGWYNIINKLSEQLTVCNTETRTNFQTITDDDTMIVQAVQVKEKFGGLRYYTNIHTEQTGKHIIDAEKESYETCEICGQPGTLVGVNWYQTLCEKHTNGRPPA